MQQSNLRNSKMQGRIDPADVHKLDMVMLAIVVFVSLGSTWASSAVSSAPTTTSSLYCSATSSCKTGLTPLLLKLYRTAYLDLGGGDFAVYCGLAVRVNGNACMDSLRPQQLGLADPQTYAQFRHFLLRRHQYPQDPTPLLLLQGPQELRQQRPQQQPDIWTGRILIVCYEHTDTLLMGIIEVLYGMAGLEGRVVYNRCK